MIGVDDAVILIPLVTAVVKAALEGRAVTAEEVEAVIGRNKLNAADRQRITDAIEADPALADLVARRRAGTLPGLVNPGEIGGTGQQL